MYYLNTPSYHFNENKTLLVFEKKILRKICGPVKDEGLGEWIARKYYKPERLWKENILA